MNKLICKNIQNKFYSWLLFDDGTLRVLSEPFDKQHSENDFKVLYRNVKSIHRFLEGVCFITFDRKIMLMDVYSDNICEIGTFDEYPIDIQTFPNIILIFKNSLQVYSYSSFRKTCKLIKSISTEKTIKSCFKIIDYKYRIILQFDDQSFAKIKMFDNEVLKLVMLDQNVSSYLISNECNYKKTFINLLLTFDGELFDKDGTKIADNVLDINHYYKNIDRCYGDIILPSVSLIEYKNGSWATYDHGMKILKDQPKLFDVGFLDIEPVYKLVNEISETKYLVLTKDARLCYMTEPEFNKFEVKLIEYTNDNRIMIPKESIMKSARTRI